MYRANMILLVLMGGGLTLWAAQPSRECRDARARNAPTADQICGRSGGGAGHSGGGFSSGSRGTSAVADVTRGGFGGFHMSAGS
jgi:uncharacterized membrane protein YgcG